MGRCLPVTLPGDPLLSIGIGVYLCTPPIMIIVLGKVLLNNRHHLSFGPNSYWILPRTEVTSSIIMTETRKCCRGWRTCRDKPNRTEPWVWERTPAFQVRNIGQVTKCLSISLCYFFFWLFGGMQQLIYWKNRWVQQNSSLLLLGLI